MRFMGMGLTALLLLSLPSGATAQENPTLQDLMRRMEALEAGDGMSSAIKTKGGSHLRIYGFLRLDMVYDDSEMDDTQTTTRVMPEGGVESDDSFTIYTRLTRLGLDLVGPQINEGDLTGKIEVDFYGGGSDSRNQFRMRHAYMQWQRNEVAVLIGQTSDVFSPLYPNAHWDMLFWNAGNPGDRRPQVRGTYTPSMGDGKLILQGALAMQGAIDAQNTDGGDGVLDGEDSGLPQLQGRVAMRMPMPNDEGRHFEVGLWGVRGWEETDTPDDDHNAYAFGVDLQLPLYRDRLMVRGELWQARNGDDFRAGIGQGINATTMQEIDAVGGWIELLSKIDDLGNVYGGYTVDDVRRSDLPAGGANRNEVLFLGFHLTKYTPFETGVEYAFWETKYTGASGDGEAHRLRVFFMYKF